MRCMVDKLKTAFVMSANTVDWDNERKGTVQRRAGIDLLIQETDHCRPQGYLDQ
jgi:hypothetical protein